jgi:hypothetical protein
VWPFAARAQQAGKLPTIGFLGTPSASAWTLNIAAFLPPSPMGPFESLGCMELNRLPLVVTFELSAKRKAIVTDALAGASAVVYLIELDEAARAEALRNTGVLLTFNTSKELRSGEAALLDGARLIQFMIGGVDFIPLGELPKGVPVATNGGGYAESMAEHALAMALAAAKRLILEHKNLKRGQSRFP